MNFRPISIALTSLVVGVAFGGMLFAQSAPRSLLAFGDCQARCLDRNELAGLITSAAILRAPVLVPGVVLESDRCVAIRHPKPEARVHYVLFPKHDTRNIATLTPEDTPFVLDCFALARVLIERDQLRMYRLQTNGPGVQQIAYLHFHLIAQ